MKKLLLAIMLTAALHCSAQVFWTETFSNSCASGCLVNSYSGPNGAWTVTSTGTNSTNSNKWFVSGSECGNAAGQCGTGCGSTDPSLHVGADIVIVVDPGAAYYNAAASNWRAESPVINCAGKSNILVSFNYLMEGEPNGDFAALGYYDGSTWLYYNGSSWTATFSSLPVTNNFSCSPQGLWTAYSVMLPSSANNNTNVKIGFRWTNDTDANATDPSFAVDDINISSSAPSCTVSINPIFPAILCYGDCNSTLSATANGSGPIQYSWNTVPVQTTPVATNLCAGIYTVTITDSVGCSSSASMTITQPTQLQVTVNQVDYNGWNITCNGMCDGIASASVSGGTPPYAYSWCNGFTTPSCSTLCAGTCYLIVADGNGCIDTAFFTVTEPPLLTVNITDLDFNGWDEPCNGDCLDTLTALASGGTPPYTFIWSNGCISSSCPNLCAGTYSVTVTDVNGCTASASYTVTEPPLLTMGTPIITNPSCNACPDGSLCLGPHGGGTPAYTYSISPNLGNFNGNCWQNLPAGIYAICITDANGCTACVSDTLVDPPSGIADNYFKDEIILSPNIISTSALLTVPYIQQEFLLVIYDCFGKKVREKFFNGKQMIIERENLSSGMYFFELMGGRRWLYSGKFIIE